MAGTMALRSLCLRGQYGQGYQRRDIADFMIDALRTVESAHASKQIRDGVSANVAGPSSTPNSRTS